MCARACVCGSYVCWWDGRDTIAPGTCSWRLRVYSHFLLPSLPPRPTADYVQCSTCYVVYTTQCVLPSLLLKPYCLLLRTTSYHHYTHDVLLTTSTCFDYSLRVTTTTPTTCCLLLLRVSTTRCLLPPLTHVDYLLLQLTALAKSIEFRKRNTRTMAKRVMKKNS